MLFHLDSRSSVPYYRQLMEQVRLHVATGTLAIGAELPSIRALAVALGVNPMTISKAYGYLESEGVLERRPGRPLIVSSRSPEKHRTSRLEHLGESLRGPALLARQLGVDKREALDVFRRLLEEDESRNPYQEWSE